MTEVRLNAYATAQVTPRIDAQVLARHARLGDQVEKGQPLVTLSSVDMAEAQGDLVVAEREWQRLTKLKGQFVSDTEYLAASVSRQKALSSVLAYGMTQEQAEALVAASEKADGTFELLALIALVGSAVLLLPRLNLDAFPDVTNVQVTVNTEAPGLAAEEVEQLTIRGVGWVRLRDIAEVAIESGPPQIRRDDVQRRVVIQANVTGRDMGGVVAEIDRRIAEEIDLPPGYSVVFGGQFENQQRAQQRLMG